MDWTLFFVILFLAVLLLWQVFPHLQARKMQGGQSPDLSKWLTEKQQKLDRLLVYFWSPSCGMCRGMTPVIDKLQQTRDDVIKINVAEDTELARQFKIMGTPTIVMLNEGNIEKIAVGAKSEKAIYDLLK